MLRILIFLVFVTSAFAKCAVEGELKVCQARQDVLIFVSLSMPETSLKALAQEAAQHHVTLVMRGLYQNSFAKTAQKMKELGITVNIDPELFDKHQVTGVPTFIQVKSANRLSGNVSLAFCLKKFEEEP